MASIGIKRELEAAKQQLETCAENYETLLAKYRRVQFWLHLAQAKIIELESQLKGE